MKQTIEEIIRYEKMADMYMHGKPVEWCEASFE
jgi:hypothetical protein